MAFVSLADTVHAFETLFCCSLPSSSIWEDFMWFSSCQMVSQHVHAVKNNFQFVDL